MPKNSESYGANIVLICTDQLRFDALGCTGSPVAKTPNLDRLASAGTSFHNHVTPCQICAPSRASLFSGLYPRHHGMVKNGLALDPSVELLSHALFSAGWETHGVGKFHFQPILAPAAYGMPESNAFWDLPQSRDWRGPYYGFKHAEFVIGESFASVRGGHYGRWLMENHPEVAPLYLPENALDREPDAMDEVWRSAVPAELHYNRWITDRSVEFLRERKREHPFFLFASYPDPHHPFSPPAPYCDNFDPEAMPMPKQVPDELLRMPDYIRNETWMEGKDRQITYREFLDKGTFAIEQGTWQNTEGFRESSVRKIIAYTHAMVQMIDDGVGRILAELEEQGLEGKTLVLFTSDHGELLGDHGLIRKGPMPYRQLLQVPMLLRGPGIPVGQTSSALTSHLDLKPTLLDLLGLDRVQTDGTSMSALLSGRAEAIRDATFAEYHPRSVPRQYNHSVVTDDFRLTLYPLAGASNWGEFFDHRDDPGEHHNRYHDPDCSKKIMRLRKLLETELPAQPEVPGRSLGFY